MKDSKHEKLYGFFRGPSCKALHCFRPVVYGLFSSESMLFPAVRWTIERAEWCNYLDVSAARVINWRLEAWLPRDHFSHPRTTVSCTQTSPRNRFTTRSFQSSTQRSIRKDLHGIIYHAISHEASHVTSRTCAMCHMTDHTSQICRLCYIDSHELLDQRQ